MGAKIDLTNALYTRLSTYTTAGSALDFVNDIMIGTRDEARSNEDLPVIYIQLIGGEEKNLYNRGGKIDEMEFKITLLDAKLSTTDDDNQLYDTDTQLGPLYKLEALLNSIEKDPDTDTMDLQFGGTQSQQPSIRYDINYTNILEINVYLILQTEQFTAGSR